jgi:hypothetical protein
VAFHVGLTRFQDYLILFGKPENDFNDALLLGIRTMESFAGPLHEHLAAEPQTLLGLARYCTPKIQFNLVTIAIETEKSRCR